MANRQRGELTLKAGKQRLTLRLTTNAVCELEDFTAAQQAKGVGRTWDQVLSGVEEGRMKDLRLFLWVALRAHHPDIATDDPASLKAIGTLIDDCGGVLGMAKQITKLVALNANTPTEDEEEEVVPTAVRPPDAQAGTGAGSTPTH